MSTTSTATLPKAMQEKYALTRPLNGGPVYVFPQYGSIRVDFSQLTARQAERLIASGWPGICRVEKPVPHKQRNSPTPLPETTPADEAE